MSLLEKIYATYPELVDQYPLFTGYPILLENLADGTGDFIKVWEYEKPLTPELQEYYRP
tara:strand:- start:61 stop:237 length:177 start_codon:yes stop_codon:yes gene_type:complete